MNPENVEKWVYKFKKNRCKTALLLVLSILIIGIVSYSRGYFEQRGKQHAIPSHNVVDDSIVASPEDEKLKKADTRKTIINQQTKGKQSPAIITNADVIINYKTKNENNK